VSPRALLFVSAFPFLTSAVYETLATLTLAVHALWILWMLSGAFLTRNHPVWRVIYLAGVLLTMFFAYTSGVCPLTDVENHFSDLAGGVGYQGGYIHHYLSQFVYLGDNFPSLAGLQMILLVLLALAILVNVRRLRF
jgi:hypothetical protein